MTDHRPPITAAPGPHRLVVTDSGLGGLAIAADLVEGLRARGGPSDFSVTYFNSCPDQDGGYNRMPGMTERIRVFDRALDGMLRFRPDRILVACNTLSVLYARTAFHARGAAPVLDIIGFGVGMMRDYLDARPGGRVLIFGTPTTIEADTHRTQLLAGGVAPGRIVVQPCDRLAGLIELGPENETVRTMIARYVGEAAAQTANRRAPVAAALCCTHYGYSAAVFEAALRAAFEGGIELLNPNGAMSRSVLGELARGAPARVDVEVVSRHTWDADRVAAMAAALAPVSPSTAAALRTYRHDPGLFQAE